MQFLDYVSLFCLFADVAFGGSLIIINNHDQCMVWSESNYGCTGYSSPFARLDGRDCSSFNVNGTHINNETLKLDICGTIDGRQVAWVNVTKDGTVSFLNQQGTIGTCSLDDDFNVGSKCSVTETGPSYSATALPVSRQTSATTSITSQPGASSSERGVSSTLIEGSTSTSLISLSEASSSAELV
ncbi:uncharacterized protein N7515_001167, partial [Penicillium bovifimosum]